jgi:Leucine-rich repeat (LRR) protein
METDFSEDYETRFNYAIEKIAAAVSVGKKSINISRLGLKKIPKELFDVIDLQELSLGNNQLSDLPKEFENFKELRILSMQKCQLKTIPEVLFKLKNLHTLNLSRNKIKTIPESIDSLKGLKNLTLAKNLIKTIPSTIGNLNRLSILELRGNLISKIPIEMSNLKRLTKITLAGNPITFPHGKILKGILPGQNALFQILHHFANEGVYNEKENSDKVNSKIEIPEALRTAFQQYLIFFNNFIEKAKSVKVDLQINQYNKGLEISYSNSIDTPKIQEYLNEYIGFIRQEVDNINPKFETKLSKPKKDIFIVELKSQVRHLTGQVEIKKVENNMLQKQVEMLHEVLVIGRQNPQPILISSKSESFSIATATSNVSIDFNIEMQSLQSEFLNFKNEISSQLSEGQLKEIELIDKDLLNVDETTNEPEKVEKTSFKRLKRLIEQINNPESDWNKAISGTKKGINLLQKIGKQYNKIAPWIAIPSIPEQLLGK